MRKLSILFVLIFSLVAFGQDVIVKDLGTMANSVNETGYVDLSKFSKIDSVSVVFVGIGELDVDSLTVYKAVKVNDKWIHDVSVLGNFTVTLNLAAGVADLEQLYSSNATLLTGAALRGCDGIYYVTRGATSGNDATDPNHGWLKFRVWGTK